MHPKCFNSVPTLALFKIIKLLDVQSIINFSQTCSKIRTLVQHNYHLGLTIPNVDDEEKIQNMEVLKLGIEFVEYRSLQNTPALSNILCKLKILKLENTGELCVNISQYDEEMISQVWNNMTEMQNIIKEMKNLRICKIVYLNQNKDRTLPLEHLNTFISIMKYTVAKTFVLQLNQNVSTETHGLNTLNFPDMIDRLVFIGPCNALLDKKLSIRTFAKNIVAKQLHENCSINMVFGKNTHIPGICVVDIIKILKNWSVEMYNNINVADMVYMNQCCAYHVAAERFYNAMANSDNGIQRVDYHNMWEKIFSWI